MDDGRLLDLNRRGSDGIGDAPVVSSVVESASSSRFDATTLLPEIHRQVAATLDGVIGSAETLSMAGLSPHHRRLLEDIVMRLGTARRLLGDAEFITRIPTLHEELSAEPIAARALVDHVIGSRRRAARAARVELANQVPTSLGTVCIDVALASRLIGRALDGLIQGTAPAAILAQGALEHGPCVKIRIVRSSVGGDSRGVEDGAVPSTPSPTDILFFEIASSMLGIRMQPIDHVLGRRGFDLRIPLAASGSLDAEGPDRQVVGESDHRPVVLVAEDARVNQVVARAMLERLGCEVIIAEDGVAALEALETRRFDVVFMDCNMPRMDGFETVVAIRSKGGLYKTLPIVALTAATQDGKREECLSRGMDDFLLKPLRLDTLRRLLERLSVIAP